MNWHHSFLSSANPTLRRRTILPGLLTVAAVALAALPGYAKSGPGRPPVPAQRTYFVTVIGLGDAPFEVQADCLRFRRKRFCTLDGAICGRWTPREELEQTRRRTAFDFDIEIDDGGVPVQVDGRGVADDGGPRSSIGAVGRATAPEESINFSFSGRETSTSRRCLELLAEWEARQGTS